MGLWQRLRRSVDAFRGPGDGWPGAVEREFELDANMIRLARSESRGARLAPWLATVPEYAKASFGNFMEIGFAKNPTAHACITALATAAPQGVIGIRETASKSPVDGPQKQLMIDAIASTETNMTGVGDAIEKLVIDLYTTGNCFWEKVRDQRGKVVELWRIHPQRVAIVPGVERFVEAYKVLAADGVWYSIPWQDMIHWSFPDPRYNNQYFGMPPMAAAFGDIQTDSRMSDMLNVYAQNNGTPATVLELPSDIEKPSEEEIQEAERTWKRKYGGSRSGGVAILPPGVLVKVIGMNWKDMDISKTVSIPRATTAMVHRVPGLLLHTTDKEATYENLQASMRQFWELAVFPLQRRIAQGLTASLMSEYLDPERYEVYFDNDDVSVVQEMRARLAPQVAELFKTSVISRHTAQKMLGSEIKGPDVFHRSNLVDAIPANATEEDIQDDIV